MPRNLESRVEQLEKRSGTDLGIGGPSIIWLVPVEPSKPSEPTKVFKGVSIDGVFHALPTGEDIDAFENRLMEQTEREIKSKIASGRRPPVSICTVRRVREINAA